MNLKNQFKSIIQWNNPQEWEIFSKITEHGDEIKNASKLILQPGQGCIFCHEGEIKSVFNKEGTYDLKTSNIPFFTTIQNITTLFESEHKIGIWFYRKANIVNIRWGTRTPIKYNDPIYGFPIALRAYGNYSIKITYPQAFFTHIVAGKHQYYCADLQDLFLSRIGQSISNYLANAKFPYAQIDSHLELIATDISQKTYDDFEDVGFELLDFRIEGTSFDDETEMRIAEISDVQADVYAAKMAGVDYTELQKLKALRDTAKNEGNAGAGMGILTGLELGKNMNQPSKPVPTENISNIKSKLKELKELFEDQLITQEEYNHTKQEWLRNL